MTIDRDTGRQRGARSGLQASTAAIFLALWPAVALADPIVVDAGRLFDGERVIEDARMVIEAGRLVAVGPRGDIEAPEGADMRDHSEHFVMPALIAAHSHAGTTQGVRHGGEFYSRESVERDLRQFALYGISAVNALGQNRPLFHELRREFRGAQFAGADLYGAGSGIAEPGGAPPREAMGVEPDQVERVDTGEEARAAVRDLDERGVDMIKIWVDDMGGEAPKMAPEIYRAVIEEAHGRGLMVAAHIHDLVDAKGVVEAGADIVAHGVRDEPIDDEFIALMQTSGAWYVPTIQIDEADYIYADHPEWLDDPFFAQGVNAELRAQIEDEAWRREALEEAAPSRKAVETNIANLRRLIEAGDVAIAMGTDSGATALRIPGFAEHREMELMAQAGMDNLAILRASTSAGAQMTGIEDLGRLEPGARAEFLVIDGDPTTDISHTRRIVEYVRP